jgi:hypothetical protein
MSHDASIAPSEATGNDALQFDHVVASSPTAAVTHAAGVVCAACQASIPTEYFDLGGHVVCERCRHRLEMAADTPRGTLPLLVAGASGLGAGIIGAIIYYSVIAIAHLEIGIVAILIGYMVGYAVRRGAGGRGGLRFQILAVGLTYLSVAFAYTPLAVSAAREHRAGQATTAANGTSGAGAGVATGTRTGQAPRPIGGLQLIAVLAAFVVTLPVAIILGNLPSSLITVVIITIGMRQAWRMTAAPILEFRGPYRVGAQAAAPA